MRRTTYFLFLLCILGSIITYTSFPTYTYAIPIAAFVLFSAYILSQESSSIEIPTYLLICLGSIWGIYLIHAFLQPATLELSIRVPIFIFVSFCCIFLIPQVIPRKFFLETVAGLATMVVIVGIPSVLIGGYSIGPLEVTPWHDTNNLFPFTIPFIGELPIMRSFFHNPNPMSEFVFVGFISSTFILHRDKSYVGLAMFILTGTGLYLGSSRATSLAAVVGLVTYVSYIYFSKESIYRMILLIIILMSTVFLMFLRLIPAPEFIMNVNLTGRLSLWQGSYRAIIERPLLGYGPGDTGGHIEPFVTSGYAGHNPHNSYLRLFVTTGFIGGTSYLVMIVNTIMNHSLVANKKDSVAVLAILLGFSTNQLFLGFSIFGISSSSVLAATTLGYSVSAIAKNMNNPK